jgi:hypothetical protein
MMRLLIASREDNGNTEDLSRLTAICAGLCERERIHGSRSAYAWRFWVSLVSTHRCANDGKDHRSCAVTSLGDSNAFVCRELRDLGESSICDWLSRHGVNTSSYGAMLVGFLLLHWIRIYRNA